MTDFIPVLLGSDLNVYGMARAFHEEYGINSTAISKTVLAATYCSKIINFINEPNLESSNVFCKTLIEYAESTPNKMRVLVPCSDGYVKLVIEHKEQLSPYYTFNCPSMELHDMLTIKDSFYKVCDKYGFEYPKTEVVSPSNYKTADIAISFPVILKASNSVEYWKCDFKGRKKVFLAQDKAEYMRILDAVYSSTYQGDMTIQEYIPGDDSNMRVLNCYVGTDKKVKLMSLGHPLLEEHTPQNIGNYVAIISTCDEVLLKRFRAFLETIGYTGFANFDMKYDSRDGKFKLFESNLRQGRASYYVTASGYNLAKWLVDDVIYHKNVQLTIAKKKVLWMQVPKGIVYKYVSNAEAMAEAKELIKAGKCVNSLFYKKDMCLKRRYRMTMNMLNHYRKYKKYFGKKGMAE